jgi:outer membrane lipoprotein carrier protein
MKQNRSLLLALPLMALIASLTAAPQIASAQQRATLTVNEVVAKMQAVYNKTKNLTGKFKQIYTDVLYNRKRRSHGLLYVKKPGMMRWDYTRPEKKSFISDGKILWVYEPQDRQAFKNPLNTRKLSTGLTFLFGSGNLANEFTITFAKTKSDLLGSAAHYVLKLVPIKPTAQYKYLVLAVRPVDFVVDESMIVNKHARNHFMFDALDFNKPIAASRFRFRPPAGIRVIDSSKLRRSAAKKP